jgi:mono/diheme cytochrome c family protein
MTRPMTRPTRSPRRASAPVLAAMRASLRCLAGAAALAALVAGCQPGAQPGSEYMPDMARGPGYKAFAPNEALRNGITLQRPVAGTIARGYRPFHYGKGEAEAIRAGTELVAPVRATPEVLASGKALYEVYCQVCHGAEGKGDGPLAAKIPPPPAYRTERLLAYPPGRLFHVITLGANKMPSYAVQLTPDERWHVIAYLRTQLQGLPDAADAPATVPAPPPTPAPPTPAPPTPAPPILAPPAPTPPTPAPPTLAPGAPAGAGGDR